MKHKHRWGDERVTFNPPMTTRDLQGSGIDMMREMIYGLSTVTQRCDDCGEARSYTVPGDARKTAVK